MLLLLFFHYHCVCIQIYQYACICACSLRARIGKDPNKHSLFTRCVSLPQRPLKTRQQSAHVTSQDLQSRGEGDERYLSCCDISYEKVPLFRFIFFKVLIVHKVKICFRICCCSYFVSASSIFFRFMRFYLKKLFILS